MTPLVAELQHGSLEQKDAQVDCAGYTNENLAPGPGGSGTKTQIGIDCA